MQVPQNFSRLHILNIYFKMLISLSSLEVRQVRQRLSVRRQLQFKMPFSEPAAI